MAPFFPNPEDRTAEAFAACGYMLITISVFQGDISFGPESNLKLARYETAVRAGLTDMYMAGVERLERFYLDAASEGVWELTLEGEIRLVPGNEIAPRLRQSLLEDPGGIDWYFVRDRFRLWPSFDRADFLLLEDHSKARLICDRVERCGLFVEYPQELATPLLQDQTLPSQ